METLVTYHGFPYSVKRKGGRGEIKKFCWQCLLKSGNLTRSVLKIQTFKPCAILNITFLEYLTWIQIKISMTCVDREVKWKLLENLCYVKGDWPFGDGGSKFGKGWVYSGQGGGVGHCQRFTGWGWARFTTLELGDSPHPLSRKTLLIILIVWNEEQTISWLYFCTLCCNGS